jgi:hypothetical protein
MKWQEVLKAQGQTDEQIKAIETTLGANGNLFDSVIVAADRANQEAQRTLAAAAEKETKINKFWNEDATPQINDAFSKVAQTAAERDFYKRQAEEAKKFGFVAADAPGYVAPNPGAPGGAPAFIPGSNPVPGSPGAPKFMTHEEAALAIANTQFIVNEHMRLFGEPLPGEAMRELMVEAGNSRTQARQVWESKYKVPEKRAEITAAAAKKQADEIRADERAKVQKEFADRYGNENTRPMVQSRFPKYAGREQSGGPDKLAWSRPDAKANFKQRIHEQVAKETGTVQ